MFVRNSNVQVHSRDGYTSMSSRMPLLKLLGRDCEVVFSGRMSIFRSHTLPRGFCYTDVPCEAMLRYEVGWFDKEENSPEVLSIRLGQDAAYVKATFSNRLFLFIQDIAAVFVALALALVLGWRFGLVALATIPLLVFASITQEYCTLM